MAAYVYEDGTGWVPLTSSQLPASGVAAGTYGDGTHVGRFTVDAHGIITAASNVVIAGGGGSAGLVPLYDSGYLGAPAATLDTGAGGIAAGHGNLLVFAILRESGAFGTDAALLRLNNDSGANYDWALIRNGGGVATPNQAFAATSAVVASIPGSTAPANAPATMALTIPFYDSTTFSKSGLTAWSYIVAGTGTTSTGEGGFTWSSTAAITRLALIPGNGNWIAGCRLLVCGTQ